MGFFSFLKELFAKETSVQNQEEQEIVIHFPAGEQISDTGVIFPVTINGRAVGGEITFESLQDRFHILNQDAISGFRVHRNEIQELVRQSIRANPDRNRYVI